MKTTRSTKKLPAMIAMMAFDLASAPIAKRLDAAEAVNESILSRLSMAYKAEQGTSDPARKDLAAAKVAEIDAEYDANCAVIEALQEQLFALEDSLNGLPPVDAMLTKIAA